MSQKKGNTGAGQQYNCSCCTCYGNPKHHMLCGRGAVSEVLHVHCHPLSCSFWEMERAGRNVFDKRLEYKSHMAKS